MTDNQKPHWDEFDSLGIEAVRRCIAEHTFGEAKKRQAIDWITHCESSVAANARTASPSAPNKMTGSRMRECSTLEVR